eukprot:gene26695-35373_t
MNDKQILKHADDLNTHGFVIIKFLADDELAVLRNQFEATLHTLPEYNQTAEVKSESRYSKTGFGALATASSFHNPFVRYLRLLAFKRLLPVFQAFDKICKQGIFTKGNGKVHGLRERQKEDDGSFVPRMFHGLVDRMLVRVHGHTVPAESWHQDVSYAVNGDTIFGGWIAFTDQKISINPGTHHIDKCHSSGGFSPIKKGSEQYERCIQQRLVSDIPAGHILLMNQTVIHEVVSTKIPPETKVLRLFTGWRLTYDETDLLCKEMKNSNSRQDGKGEPQILEQVLSEQMVPKIPSNQLPSLYNVRSVDTPVMQPGLNEWISKYIRADLLEEEHENTFFKDKKKRQREGDEEDVGAKPIKYPYPLPPIFMPSLKAIDTMYCPYQDIEKFILKPHSFLQYQSEMLQSVPSLVGSLIIGGTFVIAGELIRRGSDYYGHLVGAAASCTLIAVGASRYIATSKMMPAAPLVALGLLSSAYHMKKTYEWA